MQSRFKDTIYHPFTKASIFIFCTASMHLIRRRMSSWYASFSHFGKPAPLIVALRPRKWSASKVSWQPVAISRLIWSAFICFGVRWLSVIRCGLAIYCSWCPVYLCINWTKSYVHLCFFKWIQYILTDTFRRINRLTSQFLCFSSLRPSSIMLCLLIIIAFLQVVIPVIRRIVRDTGELCAIKITYFVLRK